MIDYARDRLGVIREVGTTSTEDGPRRLEARLAACDLEGTLVGQDAEGRLGEKRYLEGEADTQSFLGTELNEEIVEVGIEPGSYFVALSNSSDQTRRLSLYGGSKRALTNRS